MRVRGLYAVVLASMVGFLPLASPEHVHETREPDGHHHRLAHRHTSSHLVVHDHQTGTRFDDQDPVFLPDMLFVAAAAAPTRAPGLAVACVLDPSPAARVEPRAAYVERLIHAPPRAPASSRAPPASLLL